MTYAAVALPWAIIILLVWALLAGAPAGQADNLQQISVQSTEAARWRATAVAAQPTPTHCIWINTVHC